jgi:hypothetical protein
MTTIGQALGERYRIEAILGAGGMATVYRARDLRLGRWVAVKVLSPNLASDDTIARRFDQEARFLAAVNHPSIVNVFDVGDAGGEPFFVMELVEGETLTDRLARERALAPDDAVPILTQIADGLAVLHAGGFVHRDVKPQNILLPRDGAAKLADFGLVRADRPSDLTSPGTTVGTLAYLAPELLSGEVARPPSDVYGLAAVAYETLTGRPPYPVDTLVALVEGQRELPPLPSSVAPWLSTAFDAPLISALGPGDRPAMGHFAESLRAAEADWRAAGAGRPGDDVHGPAGATIAAAALPSGTSRADGRSAGASVPVDSSASTQAHAVGSVWSEGADHPATRVPVVVGLLGGVLTVALVAAMAGGLGSPSAGVAPTASPARATATPTPTARLGTTPVAGVAAAVDQFRQAVEAAQGGKDGLKGKEANELRALATRVEEAAREGENNDARERASDLVKRVDDLSEDVREDSAALLHDAALRVQRAAAALPSED